MKFTCVQCDFKYNEAQMDLGERMCNECLEKEERYVMEVEWYDPDFDFGVLTDNDLHDLLMRYKTAKLKGFDTCLGSCPRIKILSVKDVISGKLINPSLINKMLEGEL